jgi:hypothetical protein
MLSTRPGGRPRRDNGTRPVTAPVVLEVPVVWIPDQVLDLFSLDMHLLQAAIAILQSDQPTNSINVKDPKVKEFKDYCVSCYPDSFPTSHRLKLPVTD